jgi:hypothetical protein
MILRIEGTDMSKGSIISNPLSIQMTMKIIITFVLLIVAILILTAPNFVFHEKFNEYINALAAGWIGYLLYYWFIK